MEEFRVGVLSGMERGTWRMGCRRDGDFWSVLGLSSEEGRGARFHQAQEGSMTLTRKELAKAVSEKTGFPAQESADLMDRLLEILTDALEKGEQVKIPGFGNFNVREKRARKARNPKSGQERQIRARRVVTSRPSYVLRKALKQES